MSEPNENHEHRDFLSVSLSHNEQFIQFLVSNVEQNQKHLERRAKYSLFNFCFAFILFSSDDHDVDVDDGDGERFPPP
jgi:hypothetical protein